MTFFQVIERTSSINVMVELEFHVPVVCCPPDTLDPIGSLCGAVDGSLSVLARGDSIGSSGADNDLEVLDNVEDGRSCRRRRFGLRP